ncbi:MAG: hypothetical protein ACI9B8_000660 [Sulfitobacter sp.]
MVNHRSRGYVGSSYPRPPTLIAVATLDKYLAQYAEPESQTISSLDITAQFVLVVPAFQESLEQLEKVWVELSDVIIILVVNSCDPQEPITQRLLEDIAHHWRLIDSTGVCSWYQSNQHTILVVDRYHQPLPLKQGVGKARKIGADIAARLIHNGAIKLPWVFSTDADARLPKAYFTAAITAITAIKGLSFGLYPFQHDADQNAAAALYEFSLLWYAYGLKSADSEYAYTSVGSTIACSAEAYAQVRGFPNREAGEDFYLLNKLRKVGTYTYIDTPAICLSSRISNRVPFGTGPSIQKIQTLDDPTKDYVFYHPACFESLKSFLLGLRTSQKKQDLQQHFSDPLHWQFVQKHGLATLISQKQNQAPAVFEKFLMDWFDGFRTLKFVHFIREHQHPSVSFDALWNTELLAEACPGNSAKDIQMATIALWQKLLVSVSPD